MLARTQTQTNLSLLSHGLSSLSATQIGMGFVDVCFEKVEQGLMHSFMVVADNSVMQAKESTCHGLLHPQLHIIMVVKVLPRLPTASLGALRGTCSQMVGMLDSQAVSHIWSDAARKQLFNQPSFDCSHFPNKQTQTHHDLQQGQGCSTCVQLRLRGAGYATRRLMDGHGQIQRLRQQDAQDPNYITADWSPCGRWVATTKSVESSCDYDDMAICSNTCNVEVIDVDAGASIGHPLDEHGYTSHCKVAGWRITALQWLPAPTSATNAGSGLIFTSKSPVVAGMFKCGLVSWDVVNNRMKEVQGRVGQEFQLAIPCTAPATSNSRSAGKAVALCPFAKEILVYDLPSLQAINRYGAQDGLSTFRAALLSPDASKIALWWHDHQHRSLSVYDCQTTSSIASIQAPDGYGVTADAISPDRSEEAMQLLQKSTEVHYMLHWGPTSKMLVYCMNNLYHIFQVASSESVSTSVQPCDLRNGHSRVLRDDLNSFVGLDDALPAIGWIADGRVVVVMGQVAGLPEDAAFLFALHMDGTVIARWEFQAAWQTGRRLPDLSERWWNGLALSNALLAEWASGKHLLEPVWSQGLPGVLRPGDPCMALMSSRVKSSMGFVPDILGNAELSPCGTIMLLAPPEQDKYMNPKSSRPAAFCTQLLWDGNRQRMVPHATTLPAWNRFAWHPAVGFCCMFAMAVDKGDVFLVDARSSTQLSRWPFKQLSPLRSREYPILDTPWNHLAWAPDGTKLFLAGNTGRGRLAVIDLLQDNPAAIARLKSLRKKPLKAISKPRFLRCFKL